MSPRSALPLGKWVALVSLVTLLSSSCVTGFTSGSAQARPVALEVINRGMTDVVVYLAEGAVPVRLARVQALERMRLFVRRGQGPVRLLVRPLGSNDAFVPEPVWAAPGQLVELTVQPMLKTSDLVVR